MLGGGELRDGLEELVEDEGALDGVDLLLFCHGGAGEAVGEEGALEVLVNLGSDAQIHDARQ